MGLKEEQYYEEKEVTVCSSCCRACCWQGFFMCDEAYVSSTVDLTVRELRSKDLESSHYWE